MKQSNSRQPAIQSAGFFENVEDLSYGQIVLVSARWLLVAVSIVLTLWDPAPIATLRIQLMVIFLLAGANFYLHAQTLMKRPVRSEIVYAASAADLVVVSLFVLINGGFKSPLFTFYFPAIMAFAVVFPTRVTTVYTIATGLFYFLIGTQSINLAAVDSTSDVIVLVTRIIILVAIAVCGNLFLRIERGRRDAAAEAYSDLKSELGKRTAATNQS